jgi:tetratricopeptide (TPR) repeat protein
MLRSPEEPPAILLAGSDAPDAVAPTSSLAWSRSATLLFTGLLLGLLGLALWGWLAPAQPPPHGLPDDPGVTAARELMADGIPLAVPDLVLVTSLAGESHWAPADSLPVARLAAARERLARAVGRHPNDVRLDVAVAHLELSALRVDDAITRYREALDRSPRYGEARLGLGVALTARSLLDADPDRSRARALEALGQLANVDRQDPVHAAALYDRAVLLARVGRPREAASLLDRELAERPKGAWAERFRRLRGRS